MKLLVLDGNSIVNRAFYGIKLLTNKNGEYTNAIYGFLNILLKLEDICSPDAVAVAFDVHAPTFRHKMYDEYKAGRKGMPDELRAQMPVLKEMLKNLGIKTIEKEGWEADDILGTLAAVCRKNGDECFIATGDRDSLQLAHGGVKVLLARTKMGQAVTDIYDEKAIDEEYGVFRAMRRIIFPVLPEWALKLRLTLSHVFILLIIFIIILTSLTLSRVLRQSLKTIKKRLIFL